MTSNGITHPMHNGIWENHLNRAVEVEDLLNDVQKLLIPFIKSADDAASERVGPSQAVHSRSPRTVLVDYHPPEKLLKLLDLQLPNSEGKGKKGLLELVEKVLKYSVNTWDQGFLDKLYASNNAVGVISDLVLSVLNTNVHVYAVAPALTIIEKTTTRSLASLFGFRGTFAGGISTQGGSASNLTALSIARGALFPETKLTGNGTHQFVIFTSAHGHYSLSKAAILLGLGSAATISVPVDDSGQMIPDALEAAIVEAKSLGKIPFFINATAGTTVLGSFDPLPSISVIAKKYKLWFHVDGSWGGNVIFSREQKHKLQGIEQADSVAMNPHKMLGVPVTCSFLVGRDLRIWHRAHTLRAGYLFHGEDEEHTSEDNEEDREVYDLADLTLQCGRRGDALKFAMSWLYYGPAGYEVQIDHAFSVASHLAQLVAVHPDLVLVSENPPPCLQVCFYYARGGNLGCKEISTNKTKKVVRGLISRGFMIDWAPGKDEDKGGMLRVVVNIQTRKNAVEDLVEAVLEIGMRL